MPRDSTLAVAAAIVVAVALLVAAVVPGVVADPTDDQPLHPGRIAISEVPITPADVTGEQVSLDVEARLAHDGNPVRNVTVRFSAVDAASGLTETEQVVAVGTLTGAGEVPARASLSVPREGGYRVEVAVYRDGERVADGHRTVGGLSALKPAYARSTVSFAEDGLPPLAVSVADAGGNRTELRIAAALTNGGDDPSADLAVAVLVRQAESNLVAARTTEQAGRLEPGRTETVDVGATVPAEYNYRIDAVLLKDGVVVDREQTVANLNPSRTISAEETVEEVDLEVGEFETGDGDREPPRATAAPADSGAQAPGFGVAVAVVALAAVAVLGRRWAA